MSPASRLRQFGMTLPLLGGMLFAAGTGTSSPGFDQAGLFDRVCVRTLGQVETIPCEDDRRTRIDCVTEEIRWSSYKRSDSWTHDQRKGSDVQEEYPCPLQPTVDPSHPGPDL